MAAASTVSRRTLFRGGAALALAPAMVAVPASARAAEGGRSVFAPPAGVAQLARNENPVGPSPAALRAVAEAAADGCWYANRGEERLVAMVAERHGLSPRHVMVGAGSTEVLNCANIALSAGGEILTPELFFDPPTNWAANKGATVRRVPLRADMHIDLDAMAAAAGPATRLVVVVNPNNPTGLLLPGDAIRAFQRRLPEGAVLLVDEAYVELSEAEGDSLVDLVRGGAPVVVTRTFSKIHGLAGMRVGYAMGRPDLVARMLPWSMGLGGSTAGLAAAIATYEDRPFLDHARRTIAAQRGELLAAVRAAGLDALPSHANFLFVRVPDADRLRDRLAAENILIRGAYGRFAQWSRVSTGRPQDIRRYAEALPRALSG